jgi:hypothetical protein
MDKTQNTNLSCICRGYALRNFKSGELPLDNLLDAEVFEGSNSLGRKFVGYMAYSNHRNDLITSPPGMNKVNVNDDNEIAKMFILLAKNLYRSSSPKREVKVILGTGSPTEEHFNQEEALEQKKQRLIRQPYTVKFNSEEFNAAEITINIQDVIYLPEGTATMISASNTDTFGINADFEPIFNRGQNIIGINIGSTTSDVAIMKPDGSFESNGFFGLPVGANIALNGIIETLEQEYDYHEDRMKLDHLCRTKDILIYKNQEIPLKLIKESAYKDMFQVLQTKLFEKMSIKGIDIYENGALFVSGGTIENIPEVESLVTGIKVIKSGIPLYDDARGYYLAAKDKVDEIEKTESDAFERGA